MVQMDMDFTGERVVPGETPSEIYREHIARQIFSAAFPKVRDIPDLAYGTGS